MTHHTHKRMTPDSTEYGKPSTEGMTMFQNQKPRSTVKRAAIGAGLGLALMAGATVTADALNPRIASAYCGPNQCVTATTSTPATPTAAQAVIIASMSGKSYRPAGVTSVQWKAFKTAAFGRLTQSIADRFAGRLWAASTGDPAVLAGLGITASDMANQKAHDYRAVVDEIDRATGYAWRDAPLMDRDRQRVAGEAAVAELRKAGNVEALAYGGVGLENAPVDGTYGNVVARAYSPGGILFGVGDQSWNIDANARAGAVR